MLGSSSFYIERAFKMILLKIEAKQKKINWDRYRIENFVDGIFNFSLRIRE